NLNLLPLATDQQMELFKDKPLDININIKDLTTSPVTTSDGLCFPEDTGTGLPPVQAATPTTSTEAGSGQRSPGFGLSTIPCQRQSNEWIWRTDEGWGAYRQLTLASLHWLGRIMDLAEETMVHHCATPAEQWRDTHNENRPADALAQGQWPPVR
ncbi:hypothetical protein FRC10_001286, partial [Ceratobasidium sp. 414]